MKVAAICLAVVIALASLFVVLKAANDYIAPLVFNSRVERIHEVGLPKVCVENGTTVYCRMKAEDLRFPLPSGSVGTNGKIINGGFDTVEGTIEARFSSTNHITEAGYQRLLTGNVQEGAQIDLENIPQGFLIKFSYFGDR
jgi:hypothetical protein